MESNQKNILITILATALIILLPCMIIMLIIHQKDVEIANNRLESTHPYNACVQMRVPYLKLSNGNVDFDKIDVQCEKLLVDRKEYKEHKSYSNVSRDKN